MQQDHASALPENTAYTKYFEHDGALRAYAERMMWFGLSAVLIQVEVPIFHKAVPVAQPFSVIGFQVELSLSSDVG